MNETKLKKILDDLYDHKIKPDEALWEITKLNTKLSDVSEINLDDFVCNNFKHDSYVTSATICANCGGEKYKHQS